MTRLGRILVLGFLLSLGGCATHYSPLQETAGQKFLFQTNNERGVFQAAFDALSEASPSSPIEDVDGTIRGFKIRRQLLADHYTTTVRIYPASGKTASGAVVSGYYAEASGDGTLFDGPSFTEKVYASIQEKLNQLGNRVTVNSLNRGTYKLDRDRWRLTDAPSAREGGTLNIQKNESPGSRSVEERLIDLNNLREKGLITPDEYERARQNVLKGI